jgi:AAA+ ATPase superfamily predicted ATPase
VFNYIKTKWIRKEKLVIIIDEFSYLAQQDGSIPSVLQLIVDEILKDGLFHLILCGSSVSMMEKSTLAYSSPLYGRRTGQIKVQPILFRHIHKFFPGLSQDELVKIYGATGGVPFYLQFFDPNDTFQNNLRHNLFAKDVVLYTEG